MKKFLQLAVLFILIATLSFSSLAADSAYDVNNNGEVNLLDVLVVLKEITKESPDIAMDINGDGSVTLYDVLSLLGVIINGGSGKVDIYYSYTDIVSRMTDTRLLALDNTDEESEMFTSYDRKSQYVDGRYTNWRVNGDGSNVIGTTDDGGHLIADISGAGFISRIWSATSGPGHVKIFIDGEENPTVDLAFTDYFNCKAEPFVYSNLVYEDSARGKNNFVPITFNESCKVVAYGGFGDDGWGKYYHINYTLFPENVTVEPMPNTLSAKQKAVDTFFGENMGTNPEGHADAAFETFTVSKSSSAIKTITGKGAISGLLVRVDSLGDAYANSKRAVDALKNLRIKIYWDGETEPSVNAPLGDFFASSYGFTDVRTFLLGVRDDRTFYNYYYMPYLEKAKIEIYTVGDVTETVSLSVNVVENTIPEKDMMYFGTLFNLGNYHPDALTNGEYDKSAARSPDYHFLTVNGAGRFVGVTLHHNKTIDGVDPLSSPGSPWWGEGDEKFFIDGEKFPSWFGTGTEDFFGYAWCSPLLFTKAYHAQSYCEGSSNSIGNRVVTRIMMGDSIPFDERFEGYIEKYYTDEYTKYSFTSHFYRAKDSVVEGINYDDSVSLDYYQPDDSENGLVEGENLYVEAINSAKGYIDHQPMTSYSPAWSNGTQMYCGGLTVGESIDFTLPAPKDGEYMLLASFANAIDFGILQALVNGAEVGTPVDTYGTVVAADYLTELGKVTLTEGYTNTLTFEVTGKNASATNYRFGIDFVLLVPISEYKSLAEFDLSAYTDVIRLNTKREVNTTGIYTFEGETDLFETAVVDGGTAEVQNMSGMGTNWSGGKQLWWHLGTTTGDKMNVYIFVEKSGMYQMTMGITTAKDYGMFDLTLNGSQIASVDGYSASVAHKTVDLGLVTLKAGYNKLQFTITGKNASASAYLVGLDCFNATHIDESDIVIYEGEGELLTNATVSAGSARAQTMTGWGSAWSGGSQLFWTVGAANETLTTSITVDKAGSYMLSGGFTTAKDYGTIELYVNGVKVGNTFDGYNTSVAHKTADFGTVTLSAGTNTVKIKLVGKNTSATNYFVGIDYLRIVRK